jgi:hypothetical protein
MEEFGKSTKSYSFQMPQISSRSSSLTHSSAKDSLDALLVRSNTPDKLSSFSLIHQESSRKSQGFSPATYEPVMDKSAHAHANLERASSWPIRRSLEGHITLTRITDTAILSFYLKKQNRRGKFQKRLFRIDGTVLICFSSKIGTTRNCASVIDYDIIDSSIPIINTDFANALADNYPAGSKLTTLAKAVITKGNGILPEPKSHQFYIPKVAYD